MCVMNDKFVARCVNEHKKSVENWLYGDVEKVWKDKNNVLCVLYKSGYWWHYQETQNGGIEWW